MSPFLKLYFVYHPKWVFVLAFRGDVLLGWICVLQETEVRCRKSESEASS